MQDSGKPIRNTSLNRRQFVTATAAAVTAGLHPRVFAASAKPRKVFLVPNFHPASCGWLTNFSRERMYCANSYLKHLDRVRDDPDYKFLLSEANNLIAIMNFQPERMPELEQRVREKRVELVNGYFLESTINLSGGEALIRLGVEGLRWYQKVIGIKPKYGWNIDTCGVHEQMAQIAAGLGFEAMVYTRKNPTQKTMFWSVSPDGSRILTLCPGHYAEATSIFTTGVPLEQNQLNKLEALFEEKASITPDGAPILMLAGSGDYSLPPVLQTYPKLLLEQWNHAHMRNPIIFATLSDYLDPILPRIQSGEIAIPTFAGGTDYSFDAFWIDNYHAKTRYRHSEQTLQAAEMLSTLAYLDAHHDYPVQDLNDAWVLLCLNMDRNSLWGSAGGMVFVSAESWDVQDRFDWVDHASGRVLQDAGQAILPGGECVGLFNQLNWERSDPVTLMLPSGTTVAGTKSELLPNEMVLCHVDLPPSSLGGWELALGRALPPSPIELPESIETRYYSVRVDSQTGAITSLKFKDSGRELLAGPANVVIAERPRKMEPNPADFMPPRPERVQLATSSDQPSRVRLFRGPVAFTIEATGTFYGGEVIRRVIRLYHESPRIDFETELNEVPDYTVVIAQFPLAAEATAVRRGIPYGFSHGSGNSLDADLQGWTKGIVPAIRWTDYDLSSGGGFAIFDRGATGRELDGSTATIYLLNAVNKYHGYSNPWLSGEGKHAVSYAVYPRNNSWEEARIPQRAWEYNCPPILIGNRAAQKPRSILRTSDNVIVEALRCEGNHIELRMVECFGHAGYATVTLLLPHQRAMLTDLAGRTQSELPKSETYTIPVKPQQIVTMHFQTRSRLPEAEAITAWDRFVPAPKLAALHKYNPNLAGHPPFGNSSNTF